MKDKEAAKKWFYSQGKLRVPECRENEMLKAYRLEYTGQYILEVEIDSGLDGDFVEIDHITDIHFNYAAVADSDDKEIEKTKRCRFWNGDGESVSSAIKAMDVAAYADQTVITGDTLDYLSLGGIMLAKRHIIDRNPSVMMTLGGHELTKQMQTKLPDETSLNSRYEMLRRFWPHKMHYFSKTVKNKVLAVCLDNSLGVFHPSTYASLEADIKKARKEGNIIIIFMHEPIKTNNNYGEIPSIWAMSGAPKSLDFDKEGVGAEQHTDEMTDRVCALIFENADVIKGIFCGHQHSAFCTSVDATYCDESGVHSAKIPQIVTPGNPYLGHCGIVTRIIIH